MNKESRDELLERILEETARNPYKKTTRPVQRTTDRSERKAVVKAEISKSEVQKPQSVMQQTQPEVQEQQTVQTEQSAADRTQVFENPEMSNAKFSPKNHEEISAAEKIQKIKQEKAAAAKAAIMRKAEIDNSRMMQSSGNFEQQPAPVFADDDEEKVNIVMPEDEYYNDEFDQFEPQNEQGSVLTKVSNIVNYAVYIFFIIVIIFNYIFCFAGVSGDSMKPTLNDGDKLLALSIAYTPQRGDVVIIDNKTAALLDENGNVTEKSALDCMITKRIVAVGGDTIDFDFENGTVTVNGEVLEEKYISEPTTRDEGAFQYPLTIPEGYVFVLGDNRNISKDSRHGDVGLVPVDEIVGKIIFKIYPFGDFGGIN